MVEEDADEEAGAMEAEALPAGLPAPSSSVLLKKCKEMYSNAMTSRWIGDSM